MGEARRRGTYEERKAQAIKRDRKLRREHEAVEARKPKPQVSPNLVAMLGMAAAYNALFEPIPRVEEYSEDMPHD